MKLCRNWGTCSYPNCSIWEGRRGTFAGEDLTDSPNNPQHSPQPWAIFEVQHWKRTLNWRDTEHAAFVASVLLACKKSSKLVLSLHILKPNYVNILEDNPQSATASFRLLAALNFYYFKMSFFFTP